MISHIKKKIRFCLLYLIKAHKGLYYEISLNENKFLDDELVEIISNSIYTLNITYIIKRQWLFLGI